MSQKVSCIYLIYKDQEIISMRERYVSFEPWWGGFSNVKISYEIIGAISIITDRIIILPPRVHCHFLNYARNKNSYLNIWEILEESSFRSNFNTIDYRDIEDYRKLEDEYSYFSGIEKIAKIITFDGKNRNGANSEIGENQIITNEIVNPEDLEIFRGNRELFSIISEEKYLHFPRNLFGHFCSQIYGNSPEVRNLIKRRIREGIVFRKDLTKIAEKTIESIGLYNSIHVRRSDFMNVHPEDVKYQESNLLQILEREMNPDLPLYISTDEKDVNFFKSVSKKYKTYFTNDFFHQSDEKHKIALDQIVCSHSDIFLGSKFSTFTNSINIQRGYLQKKDFSRKGINFDYGGLAYSKFPWEREKYSWEKINDFFWKYE